jgi:hypothetical protein
MFEQILIQLTGFNLRDHVKLMMNVQEMETEDLQDWLENSKGQENPRTRTKRMIVINELIERTERKE